MDTLREERIEIERENDKRLQGAKRLQDFFDALEADPMAFCKSETTKVDIYEKELDIERARCMRKITVFKCRLEQLYKEFAAFQLELMNDKLYSEIQERILLDMSKAISGFYELIDYYEEELLMLGIPITELEKEFS